MANQIRIGRYNINREKRLGGGTFGTVFLGTDDEGKSIAAKEIYLGDLEDEPEPNWIARVRAEVEAHKKIPPHRNLIRYVDSITKGNLLWIFTEQCTHGDLNRYAKGNNISQRQKFVIMKELAEALRHIHSLKPAVVHRDVKPENILIGDDGKVKLCDLGLAKITERVHNKTLSLKTHCGTEDYMAPELFIYDENGNSRYNKKVDVFSAGIFYVTFIDSEPKHHLKRFTLKGQSIGRVMHESSKSGGLTAPPIKFQLGDSPQVNRLKVLASNMIQFDPDDRPTIEEVIVELDNILASMPEERYRGQASEKVDHRAEDVSRIAIAEAKPNVLQHSAKAAQKTSEKGGTPTAMHIRAAATLESHPGTKTSGAVRQLVEHFSGMTTVEARPEHLKHSSAAAQKTLVEKDGTSSDLHVPAASMPEQSDRQTSAAAQPFTADLSGVGSKKKPIKTMGSAAASQKTVKKEGSPVTMALPEDSRSKDDMRTPMIIGGFSTKLYRRSCACWRQSQDGSWDNVTSVPENLSWIAVSAIKNGLFMAGGCSENNKVTNHCYVYLSSSNDWRRRRDMPTARRAATAVTSGDTVFVLGGNDNEKPLNVCEVYNVVHDEWTSESVMLQGMAAPIAALIQSHIFILFHDQAFNKTTQNVTDLTLQIFNTMTGEWKFGPSLPVDYGYSRTFAARAVSYNDTMLVIGGLSRMMVQYTPRNSTWCKLTSPHLFHGYAGLVVRGCKVVVMGGAVADGSGDWTVGDDIEEYDVEQNKWVMSKEKMPCALWGHDLVFV